MPRRKQILPLLAAVTPFAVFVVVYGPAVGHGFIKDDFDWIADHIVTSWSQLPAIFLRHSGFYRPLVGLSFAVSFAFFGLNPLPYGLTNLCLALLCAGAVYRLARSLGLMWGSSALAGSLWLLNVHGINMAVLWISGRTSLLLTAFSVLAATTLVKGQLWRAATYLACALLSKEEAVALPLVLATWLVFLPKTHGKKSTDLLVWCVTSTSLLIIYLWLRQRVGAMTPATAPFYYRLTSEPELLLRNIAEYFDRSATIALAATLIGTLIMVGNGAWRCLRTNVRTHLVWCGVIWAIGGYGLTVFLPVRSSLYACFPSVGVALAAAATLEAVWASSPPEARRRTVFAALVIALALAPIHMARRARWTELADLSRTVLPSLDRLTAPLPVGSGVILYDDLSTRKNLRSTFGTSLNRAYHLRNGRRLNLWLEPPIPEASLAGLSRPCHGCEQLTLILKNGVLVRSR